MSKKIKKKCIGCKKYIATIELPPPRGELPSKKIKIKMLCKSCIQIIENVAKENYFYVRFIIDEFKD